jgi:dihydrofolate synthase/folylpolyglutamate synthase
MISNYDDALAFLFSRTNLERGKGYAAADMQLDRVRELLARVGNPQERLPAVHVTGTKGKGSTAALAAAALTAAGYRVGLFTSPHVARFEERLTVDGREPPPETVVELVRQVAEAVAETDRRGPSASPTFFETVTAVAWLYFLKEAVDVVVLEVGLGGRLDATNVCRPVVCAVTTVSRDHTELLGRTVEEIAAEKAGIVKPGVPVVVGRMADGARAVVESVCRRLDARTVLFGRDVRVDADTATVETPGRRLTSLKVSLPGAHQLENAALATALLDVLGECGFAVPEAALRAGFASVSWPLRCEVATTAPTVVLDAAHNWASAGALAATLPAFGGRRRFLVFAASGDKDVSGMLRRLLPGFDSVVLTRYTTNPRATAPERLREVVARLTDRPVHLAETSQKAWSLVRQWVSPEDLVCVTGSFFVAAEFRQMLAAN